MQICFSGKDIRTEWNLIKTRYFENYRNNDDRPTYYRSADLKFLNDFVPLSEEEKLRCQQRLQREFELKIATMQDDEVINFAFH